MISWLLSFKKVFFFWILEDVTLAFTETDAAEDIMVLTNRNKQHTEFTSLSPLSAFHSPNVRKVSGEH